MATHSSRSENKDAGEEDELRRRNPYEVLGIPSNSTDQEIKSAYRRMALRYHPDKNPDDPVAADMFKEVTFAYEVLSDPENRRLYDTTGSEAVGPENEDLELDLSSLGAVNTIFAALFNKLGVQIKTTVSANLLGEALNGTVTTLPLMVGQVVSRKVEKQSAHFYSVTLTEEEAQDGLICKVHSSAKNKFKLLYFDQVENGGLSLALQTAGKQESSRLQGCIFSASLFIVSITGLIQGLSQGIQRPDFSKGLMHSNRLRSLNLKLVLMSLLFMVMFVLFAYSIQGICSLLY
ncbi:DnaJ domain [Arabidopsis thaliana x Arabidopsis arenosa]|uniref:DnaJ domain n=1 Tax=Arabidopsis thaliana x Arabidopsis arenosa TaxID=1240361 RepID=A0A8T2GRX2_9BRAS|nr:DnaJ domain [Arabidopsis thaliana x Arabidopsis arenosa]